jgi:hypothetical protein
MSETMDDKTLLKVYRQEIEQLKAKLQALEMQTKFINSITGDDDNGGMIPTEYISLYSRKVI